MSWLGSFFIAVSTAVVAAIAGGIVGAGYVDWYQISGREGESGYSVIAAGLLGCIVGFFVGLILSRFVGGSGAVGLFKGLGICAGATLGLAGAAALAARVLADIPPLVNGHQLDLMVEIRLPKGAADPSARTDFKKFIELHSNNFWNRESRRREPGDLQVSQARQAEGRWIIPGSVFLFTTRARILDIILDEKQAVGFELDFPGHPGPKNQQWSEWLPSSMAGRPWPDTEVSYRFRVQDRKPPPDPAVVAEAEFAALTPDSPLDKWLSFLYDTNREQAVVKAMEARPADLAKLLHSPDSQSYSAAMYAVTKMKVIDPEVMQAMRDVASDIEVLIRKFNTLKPGQDTYVESEVQGHKIENRFGSWIDGWWNVHQVTGVDTRPPLGEILQLASVQKESLPMKEIVAAVQVQLDKLTPPAK